MTRLDRILQVFKDYDDLVDALKHVNSSQDDALKDLRDKVSVLAGELIQYGCRRRD